MKGFALLALMAGTASAAPTVDSVLCNRKDDRFDDKDRWYLSVNRPTVDANVTESDDKKTLTVCTDAAKTKCHNITEPKDADFFAAISPDAATVLVASQKGLVVVDGKSGKVKTTLTNKRDKEYSCGGAMFLGDTVLALGADCHEFDALPYLASKGGKYIGPLVDDKLTTNGETVFDAVQLDGKLWAVAIYDHYAKDDYGLGKVFVIDVTTGKINTTVQGTKTGATIEGKTPKKLDSIGKCS